MVFLGHFMYYWIRERYGVHGIYNFYREKSLSWSLVQTCDGGKYEVYKYWAGGGTLREQYENTNSKACQEIFLTSALIIWLCTLSYHIDILHY